MPRQRNNMRRRRRNGNNNNRNRRRAHNPSQVSRAANQTSTRTFRAIANIFFQQEATETSGVQGAFAFTAPVSSYTGTNYVSDNFEQYRVRWVEVLMKPSAQTLNNGTAPSNTQEAIAYQNSVYSAMNATYVQSFIDYDTATNPTFTECLTRPQVKVSSLSPTRWTKIARFAPRTLSNPSFTGTGPSTSFGSNTWMATENLSTELLGVRGMCTNSSPVFDTQDNVMSISVRLSIVVEMKGMKNTSSTTGVSIIGPSRPLRLPPMPSSTEDRAQAGVEEDDGVGDNISSDLESDQSDRATP